VGVCGPAEMQGTVKKRPNGKDPGIAPVPLGGGGSVQNIVGAACWARAKQKKRGILPPEAIIQKSVSCALSKRKKIVAFVHFQVEMGLLVETDNHETKRGGT